MSDKITGALTHMEQLLAFCDWERKHNPHPEGKTHVAEWASAEIERLAQRIASLEAENARLRVDAERYRLARDANADDGLPYIARERQDSWGNFKTEWLMGEEADTFIDAARGDGHGK